MPTSTPQATIRLATENDAEQIAAIYAPIVRDTWISFETSVPTADQFRQRIQHVGARYPWLVCANGDDIMGYVYGSLHSERAAYMWSVNITVYIKDTYRRLGVGQTLYTTLFELLKLLGYYNAFAGVTLPNDGSVGLHESLGFQKVSHYKNTGYKFGKWLDVGWWQLQLQDLQDSPSPPRAIGEIVDTPEYHAILAAGLSQLKQPFSQAKC